MQKPKSRYIQKKEPFSEKINPASHRPSAYRRVAFFRRCGKRKR